MVTHSSTPPGYASGKVTFHVPVGVPVGELLCLCGPNGPGKSTLLEMRKHWQLLLPLRFETAKDIGERAEHELAEPPPRVTDVPEQRTVIVRHEDTVLKAEGRHDPCVLPRAVVIVEAMAALVMVDHALRHAALAYQPPA